jgi:replicative DNA helicase
VLTPAVLAERAALGALLLHGADDPAGRSVLRWLRPGDFADPWHREVYSTIRDQIAAERAFDAHTVGLCLIDRLGYSRADVVRVAGLLRATPPRPDPGRYAGIVLDVALRREVAGLGVLLRGGALATVLDGTPRPLLGVTAAVDARIDAVERRWQDAHAPSAADSAPFERLTGHRLAGNDARIGADRMLAAHPLPPATRTAEREADLIASVIARPATLAEVGSWLRPEAITNDAWRPIFAATLALARRGDAIDPVTVLWEVGRATVGGRTPVDPAAVLARIEVVLPRHPGALARDVAADHLRRRAEDAAATLYAATTDLSRSLPDVLGVARTHTADVRAASRPLAASPLRVASPARALAPPIKTRTLEAG